MKLEYEDIEVELTLTMYSLIGVMKKEYPVKWGNYFSATISLKDCNLVLNYSGGEGYDDYSSYYPVININKENFEYLIKSKIVTQPVKVRVFKKDRTGIAIIDERIPQEYYRLWTRGYCNSGLSDKDLTKVAKNLTSRFTALDENLEYIYK